ncbi:MAG TPA: hypothetical protein VLA12_18685 [Planctomycetaceae bacterium]|nr:hypothetical protein [Planctomycetaceae bacterium]
MKSSDELSSPTTGDDLATQDSSPAETEANSTPDAVFAALKHALIQKDWQTIADCIDQRTAAGIVGFALVPADLAAKSDPEAKRQLDALFAKYARDQNSSPTDPIQDPKDRLISSVTDIHEFMVDLMNYLDIYGQASDYSEAFAFDGEFLENVEIQGDKAMGILKGETGERTIEFIKVDDSWRIALW